MNKIIVLVGLPGSGKSTHASKLLEKENANGNEARIFSSDAIREELYGDESILGNANEVFQLLEERLISYIETNPNATAIYDATNLTVKTRKGLLNRLKKVRTVCYFECHFVACRLSVCKSRQFTRDRKVPEEVIDRMVRQFQAPYYNEGWDAIHIIEGGRLYDIFDEHDDCWDVPHDNPHHALSIGQHMARAWRIAASNGADTSVILATTYHDIGKPHTKSFTNMKGEPTEFAHYYSHESVGSYMWLCSDHGHDFDTIKILVGALIQWHMIPYFLKEDTKEELLAWCTKRGFTTDFGESLWAIHQADKSAH